MLPFFCPGSFSLISLPFVSGIHLQNSKAEKTHKLDFSSFSQSPGNLLLFSNPFLPFPTPFYTSVLISALWVNNALPSQIGQDIYYREIKTNKSLLKDSHINCHTWNGDLGKVGEMLWSEWGRHPYPPILPWGKKWRITKQQILVRRTDWLKRGRGLQDTLSGF